MPIRTRLLFLYFFWLDTLHEQNSFAEHNLPSNIVSLTFESYRASG